VDIGKTTNLIMKTFSLLKPLYGQYITNAFVSNAMNGFSVKTIRYMLKDELRCIEFHLLKSKVGLSVGK
jgi:hypothetical protein